MIKTNTICCDSYHQTGSMSMKLHSIVQLAQVLSPGPRGSKRTKEMLMFTFKSPMEPHKSKREAHLSFYKKSQIVKNTLSWGTLACCFWIGTFSWSSPIGWLISLRGVFFTSVALLLMEKSFYLVSALHNISAPHF